MDRRVFIKALGLAGGSALTVRSGKAAPLAASVDQVGVLVDTTRCVGCRTCEVACAEAHGLPEPDFSDSTIFDRRRNPTESQWTVVNRFKTTAGDFFAKRQCMHCSQPACAAACPTKAMYKTKEGPVIWREDKCMGCRYCMISCPFDIPKFEYDKAVPKIQKCILCWDRLQEGKKPACVESCPAEALLFGKRSELIEAARTRIYANPDKYYHRIYGEREVGGTGYLYLSAVPFDQMGFRNDLGTTAYPEYTREFLYGVPIVLILWPAMLLALHKSAAPE
jgi:formate dehydrogenase iron-sulfur subunit